jgi:hypothetical protein
VRKLALLFLLFSLPFDAAQADPLSVREKDMNTVALVSTQMWVQCDSIQIANADGTLNINTNKCIIRWKVGTTNYCSRTAPYEFFVKLIAVKLSVHEALMNIGTVWMWEQNKPMPVEADPWCLQ